jgi:rubrerythrin
MTERDEAFETLCEVSGIDWQKEITTDQRGRVNAALKQLRDIYGDDPTLPQMIRDRAEAWGFVYPEIPVTPQTLTHNWSQIIQVAQEKAEREKQTEGKKRVATNQHAKHGCATCGDDHVVVVGTNAEGHDLTAPCPDCNPHANATYWAQRRKIEPLDPAKVREMLSR